MVADGYTFLSSWFATPFPTVPAGQVVTRTARVRAQLNRAAEEVREMIWDLLTNVNEHRRKKGREGDRK